MIDQIRDVVNIARAGSVRYDAPSPLDRIPLLLDQLQAELREQNRMFALLTN